MVLYSLPGLHNQFLGDVRRCWLVDIVDFQQPAKLHFDTSIVHLLHMPLFSPGVSGPFERLLNSKWQLRHLEIFSHHFWALISLLDKTPRSFISRVETSSTCQRNLRGYIYQHHEWSPEHPLCRGNSYKKNRCTSHPTLMRPKLSCVSVNLFGDAQLVS